MKQLTGLLGLEAAGLEVAAVPGDSGVVLLGLVLGDDAGLAVLGWGRGEDGGRRGGGRGGRRGGRG